MNWFLFVRILRVLFLLKIIFGSIFNNINDKNPFYFIHSIYFWLAKKRNSRSLIHLLSKLRSFMNINFYWIIYLFLLAQKKTFCAFFLAYNNNNTNEKYKRTRLSFLILNIFVWVSAYENIRKYFWCWLYQISDIYWIFLTLQYCEEIFYIEVNVLSWDFCVNTINFHFSGKNSYFYWSYQRDQVNIFLLKLIK